MAKILKVEPRTEMFIDALQKLKKLNKKPSNVELARVLGIASASTITEITSKRQNIQPEAWKKFMAEFGKEFSLEGASDNTETAESAAVYRLPERKNNIDALLEIVNNQSSTITILSQTIKKQEETIHFLIVKGGDAGGLTASSM